MTPDERARLVTESFYREPSGIYGVVAIALRAAYAEGRAAALEAAALWCEADAEEYGSGTEKAYALRRAASSLRALAQPLASSLLAGEKEGT